MLEILSQRGVPNYFGEQRFGLRGDTWEVGRALLHQDFREAVEVILGRPGPADYGEVLQARQLFEQGDYLAAAEAWPYPFSNEKQLARAMHKYDGNAQSALKTINKKLRRFYFSAYQSQLFNQVVARRLDNLARLLPGDMAWRHPQGAIFKVESVEREQPRCEVFEISPTGPLFGYKMRAPEGEAWRIEQDVLNEENMTLEDWRESGKHKIKGGRRPLRFQPQETGVEAGVDDAGEYLQLTFYLEAGCYATTVLREICKWPIHPGEPAQ
jgi:tRNA pseudouridine13 synthase